MITKMEKASVVFIRFRSSDVITASGDDPVPVVYTQIWLSSESAKNFNNYDPDDIDLLYNTKYNYWAYNGNIYDFDDPVKWNYADRSITPPPKENLYNVGVNDAAGYQRVLDWLTGASKKASN